jgi:uncharacterized protein
MKNQNQVTLKVSQLIGAFSILGFIYLVCILIWQKSNTVNYVINSFSTNTLVTNLSLSGSLGILMAVIAIGLVRITGTKIPDEDNEQLKELMMSKHGAIIIAILPGFFEEILFRGFILPFFIQYTNPTWAVIITTIVFWAIHLPQYKYKIVLNFNVIMLSMVTSILFIQTDTLWASIFAHIVYNYFVTLAIQKKIVHI